MPRAALIAAALAALPARGTAAQDFVDRGALVIQRAGAETGRVDFALRRTGAPGSGGYLLVASTRTPSHEIQLAVELTGDSLPSSFTETETVSGRAVRRVSATLGGHRLTARASSPESETSRELPVIAPLLILGDDDFASFTLLPEPPPDSSRALSVLLAGDLTLVTARVSAAGADTLRIAGRDVPCRRFALLLSPDDERTYWKDQAGGLIRVAVPARGLIATRTAPPAHPHR